jgi:outer membrane biosynthesis protein TonB
VDLVRTQLAASFATEDAAAAARLTRAARSLASIDPERRGVGGLRLQVELALFAMPAAPAGPSASAERPAATKPAPSRASPTPPPAAEPTPVPAAAPQPERSAPEPVPPAAAAEPTQSPNHRRSRSPHPPPSPPHHPSPPPAPISTACSPAGRRSSTRSGLPRVRSSPSAARCRSTATW